MDHKGDHLRRIDIITDLVYRNIFVTTERKIIGSTDELTMNIRASFTCCIETSLSIQRRGYKNSGLSPVLAQHINMYIVQGKLQVS